MNTGEDKQLSLLGMAKSHEPAHLSSDTFWYIVTGRQSWSWCAARARTISWCRKPSLCCTALVRVLPSTESLPTCSNGSANVPVASSPKYSQIFLASSAMRSGTQLLCATQLPTEWPTSPGQTCPRSPLAGWVQEAAHSARQPPYRAEPAPSRRGRQVCWSPKGTDAKTPQLDRLCSK